MIILGKNNRPISKEIYQDKQIIPAWRQSASNGLKSGNNKGLQDYEVINNTLYKKIDKKKYLDLQKGGVKNGTN